MSRVYLLCGRFPRVGGVHRRLVLRLHLCLRLCTARPRLLNVLLQEKELRRCDLAALVSAVATCGMHTCTALLHWCR